MTPIIMKIGTMPAEHYWLWGNKKISSIKEGDRIKFIKQKSLTNIWEHGIVRKNDGDFPFVDRV